MLSFVAAVVALSLLLLSLPLLAVVDGTLAAVVDGTGTTVVDGTGTTVVEEALSLLLLFPLSLLLSFPLLPFGAEVVDEALSLLLLSLPLLSLPFVEAVVAEDFSLLSDFEGVVAAAGLTHEQVFFDHSRGSLQLVLRLGSQPQIP